MAADPGDITESLHRAGFALLPQPFDADTVQKLKETLNRTVRSCGVYSRSGEVFAIRHLSELVPEIRDFAFSPEVRGLVGLILGAEFNLVRSTLFDKVSRANWKVTWHQDLTIAVRERKNTPGFTCWTKKAGIVHVQPPTEILEGILTVRIHLDQTNESNGALKVIPGSHRYGRLLPEAINRLKEKQSFINCDAPAGGVLLMRPLILHASSAAVTPHHRRVLHLEYSAARLPNGLEWYGS